MKPYKQIIFFIILLLNKSTKIEIKYMYILILSITTSDKVVINMHILDNYAWS